MKKEAKEKGRFVCEGIEIPPKPDEYDINDPFYGSLRVKKNTFVGKVISVKSTKTACVLIDRLVLVKKYSRYLNRSTKIQVHNPPSINAKEGDVVKVIETRPISKTKHHVIVQVLGKFVDIKGQDLSHEAKNETEKTKKKQETSEE
jgi:small subunit ribosomal protein S17